MFPKNRWFPLICCLTLSAAVSHAATVSPLLARGYTVLPEPQRITLREGDFQTGPGWRLDLGLGVARTSAAVEALPVSTDAGAQAVRLEIAPGAVVPGRSQDQDRQAIAEQAYKIELRPARIRIVANAPSGLFYGVETLLQLLKKQDGGLWLPQGEIVDWPDLRRRHLYWDDAHHVESLDVLKRAVRQAAFFKINGFAVKLEGHFQYRHAPALVEPYALSPAEFQELTDYGLRYFVQVIPYLDSPGHIAFILKHPEYAGLREFPDSNYELCATNPASYKLLYGMFDDLMAANQGVKYFYLSTDEPYYVGMANNAQCQEGARAKELGGVGGMLAEFVTKTADYLHARGRTVIFWGEYPMKPGDIPALPKHVVNGETYGHAFDTAFRANGIRQMLYTSTEGEEKLFPQYFTRKGRPERVEEAVSNLASDSARRDSDLTGMLVAGWGDMGLHPETFWLGYATIAAAGWRPDAPGPHEAMSAFYPLFYGPKVERMDRVYQLMSYQAQLWTDTWNTVDSTARKPIWGNSERIFTPPHPAHDQTVPLPPDAQTLHAAEEGIPENDELLGLLDANLRLAERNRYNLEVFLSIAHLYRQNLDMLAALGRIDHIAGTERALQQLRAVKSERNRVLRDAAATWSESWRPRVAEANGRWFLHEMDDVKDHLPDRTVGMEYLIYRELLLPMDAWYEKLAAKLPVKPEPLNWKDLN